MAGHAQLKSVMTECSKTQIRLTGLIYKHCRISCWHIPIFSLTLYHLTLPGNRRLIPKMLFLPILIRAIVDLHFYLINLAFDLWNQWQTYDSNLNTVMFLSFRTDRFKQTCRPRSVKEQSDHGLHCLPFHLHLRSFGLLTLP